MNPTQRKFLAWTLFVGAIFLHLYVGDWEEADEHTTGCYREIGYQYKPGPVVSNYGYKHDDFLLLITGWIVPGALSAAGVFLKLGGQSSPDDR